MIRAPTWGERWDLWRAANAQEAVAAPIDEIPNSTSMGFRARVPFLASASSNLDEGFEPDEDEPEGAADESVLAQIRPSPRKVLAHASRRRSSSSKVLWEKQYDGATLEPPLRSSTPVDGTHSPPLPPYSESEVSDVSRSGNLVDVSTDTTRSEQLAMEESIAQAVIEELERRADAFYRTGLLGRCWDIWGQATGWLQVGAVGNAETKLRPQSTSSQIDTVRNTILLRHTLQKWRNSSLRMLDLPNTADAHREYYVQSHAFRIWLHRTKERDLLNREIRLTTARQHADVRRCWKIWRGVIGRCRTDQWKRNMESRESRFASVMEAKLLERVCQVRQGKRLMI